MKVPRGLTVKQLVKQFRQSQVSTLRAKDRATPQEREAAKRSLMRRCPYLVKKTEPTG